MDFFGTKKKKKKRKGASPTLRVKIVLKQKGKCKNYKRCGVKFGKITPVIHHKDGDRSNKDESNLEALCRNCHEQKDERVRRKLKSKKPKQDDFGIGDLFGSGEPKRRKKSSDSYADSLGDLNDNFGL